MNERKLFDKLLISNHPATQTQLPYTKRDNSYFKLNWIQFLTHLDAESWSVKAKLVRVLNFTGIVKNVYLSERFCYLWVPMQSCRRLAHFSLILTDGQNQKQRDNQQRNFPHGNAVTLK